MDYESYIGEDKSSIIFSIRGISINILRNLLDTICFSQIFCILMVFPEFILYYYI